MTWGVRVTGEVKTPNLRGPWQGQASWTEKFRRGHSRGLRGRQREGACAAVGLGCQRGPPPQPTDPHTGRCLAAGQPSGSAGVCEAGCPLVQRLAQNSAGNDAPTAGRPRGRRRPRRTGRHAVVPTRPSHQPPSPLPSGIPSSTGSAQRRLAGRGRSVCKIAEAQGAGRLLGITQSVHAADAGFWPWLPVPCPPGCDSVPSLALVLRHLLGSRPASEVPWVAADGSR